MASPSADTPPLVWQLASHPLRWRLLLELAASDRKVDELVGLTGEAQNLVSYHLGKLRDAGLVTGRRSARDGRASFYRLDLDRFATELQAAAGALHPALVPAPMSSPSLPKRMRVLFLCSENRARSQMAEALLRARGNGEFEAFSAGIRPGSVHPKAISEMSARGIDMSGQTSKHVNAFANQEFDVVVTVCDFAREECPEFPGDTVRLHWSLPDPANPRNPAEEPRLFADVAAELDQRVQWFLGQAARIVTAA